MITNNNYLLADIGGTNSNFIIYDKFNNKIISKYNFKTNKIENFNEFISKLISKIIDEEKILIENCVLAVAGKINNRKKEVKLTNQNLIINSKEILNSTPIKKIDLINDFSAIAYSILDQNKIKIKEINKIKIEKIKKLNSKNSNKYKNILILGAGTGLGVSFIKLNKNEKKIKIKETELGHLEFDPIENQEKELEIFIKNKLKIKKIQYENILSGNGLELIYQFISKNKNKISAKEISKQKNKNEFAKKTFEIFYKIKLEFIKKLFLHFKYEEIYLAGGIIQNNLLFSNNILSEKINSDIFFEKIQMNIIKNYDCSIDGLINYINLK